MMYRIFEGVRHAGNRSDVPGIASQRRIERSAIYADAQARLGETAHFAVMLMWALRDDGRILTADSLRAADSKLVDPRCGIREVGYEDGKDHYTSHVDWLVVTSRNDQPTGARLKPHDTSMYVAYSLVHAQELMADDRLSLEDPTVLGDGM